MVPADTPAAAPAPTTERLKADTFGAILLVGEGDARFVRRDLGAVKWWARGLARWLAHREARALRAASGLPGLPRLLAWDGIRLDRSYLDGCAMYQRPPRGDLAYFRAARSARASRCASQRASPRAHHFTAPRSRRTNRASPSPTSRIAPKVSAFRRSVVGAGAVKWWARGLARWLAHREARALRAASGLPGLPRLLAWDGIRLDRSYLDGCAMYQRPPRGDLAYFRAARRLLLQLRRRGIAHNDLAKEANWLVRPDGRPAIVDFQLAFRGPPRARWLRLLAREDLRHLLKHKRTYCREALTPVERRLLARTSWFRDAWFATGKPVYRLVTRRVLRWRDNEGRGPRP